MFHSDNRYIEEKSVEVVEFLDLIMIDHDFHLSLICYTEIIFESQERDLGLDIGL